MKAYERKCPKCAEVIKKEALVCKHCGAQFSADEVAALKRSDAANKRNGAVGCLVIVVLLFVLGQCAKTTQSEEDKARIAAKEKADAEEDAEQKASDRKNGFHCLSSWDGSNRSLKSQVENALRNPSSFEHIETRIAPVNKDGQHPIVMRYRAQNGFGGMNVETAVGVVDPVSCNATVMGTGI